MVPFQLRLLGLSSKWSAWGSLELSLKALGCSGHSWPNEDPRKWRNRTEWSLDSLFYIHSPTAYHHLKTTFLGCLGFIRRGCETKTVGNIDYIIDYYIKLHKTFLNNWQKCLEMQHMNRRSLPGNCDPWRVRFCGGGRGRQLCACTACGELLL